MKKRYFFLIIPVLIFQIGYSSAQETLMDAVSNVYLQKLIAAARENYPRISAHRSQIAIAKTNVISQKSNWLDGLSFNYVYKPNNTLDIVNPTFFNGYQVAVSFSVTELFQKSSNVKQAKEGLKIAEYDQEEYNLSLEANVKTRYYTYLQQKRALALQYRMHNDALNLSKEITLRYRKGEVTLSDYLQAQSALNQATAARDAAEAGLLAATATLEELTVKKLEEIR